MYSHTSDTLYIQLPILFAYPYVRETPKQLTLGSCLLSFFLVQVIAPTNAEVLPVLPEPESLELKKHLKQVSEEGRKGRGVMAAAGLL